MVSSSKAERRIVEKNRRNQMKALYSQLNSLLPHHSPEETLSLPDQLEEVHNYIIKLQENLQEMKQKKNSLIMGSMSANSRSFSSNYSNPGSELKLDIDIHVNGSLLDMNMITGLDYKFMFTKALRILHEQGAEVVNASFYQVDQRVIHVIHSKIGDCEVECEAARICERLRKLVDDAK